MSLISRDVAIIMLVTAALGIIGVFPLISSALVMAQAVQWLQLTSKTATIYKLAIAAIVFASLELLAVMGVAAFAAKFYPAFNFAIIFGGSNFDSFKTPMVLLMSIFSIIRISAILVLYLTVVVLILISFLRTCSLA